MSRYRIALPLVLALVITIVTAHGLSAQSPAMHQRMAGSAFIDNASYDMLRRLSDEAGGRWIGSAQNEQGMRILVEELRGFGLTPRLETFSVPGWVRGDDEVRMLEPSDRVFRAVALGYVNRTPAFDAAVVWANRGLPADFDSCDVSGRIALVTQEGLQGVETPLRSETILRAAAAGARAVLFVNEKKAGQILCGMGNFHGDPAAVPAFSITWVEGQRLKRLLSDAVPVRMRITANSYCTKVESANVVCTLPGKSDDKIVIGAHFDSWDVGQGSVDNGIGTALLFDVARILSALSPANERTIEFVWFNGEEMGLWGSRRYVEMHANDRITAMVNMDMTGSPRGFGAMGNDHFLPLLNELIDEFRGYDMSRGVINSIWTNSDHQPFMLAGIPTITPLGHLDKETVETYHDFGDTFDLVNKKYLSEAAGVVSVLAYELANRTSIPTLHRTPTETMEYLRKGNLEERLKRQGEWPFE
ncbi:MAG: M28 family peptidase [Bacteroidetes bacterium]|nr:M28 family peptidase [Bacteroidota bacterium]